MPETYRRSARLTLDADFVTSAVSLASFTPASGSEEKTAHGHEELEATEIETSVEEIPKHTVRFGIE